METVLQNERLREVSSGLRSIRASIGAVLLLLILVPQDLHPDPLQIFLFLHYIIHSVQPEGPGPAERSISLTLIERRRGWWRRM